MIALKTLMAGTMLSLTLLGGVTAPAYADKIGASGKNPPVTSGSPTDIEIATPIDAIDFGDDTSEWAKDGECDDPRFAGTGSAEELLDEDIRKDATDCRAAYEAGTVKLAPAAGSDATATPATTTEDTATMPDFGDDSSEYADDGECDDPRFTGIGMADEPLLSDTGKDASDCKLAFEAGSVTLKDAGSASLDTPATVATTGDDDIDYGDDTSEWAKDDECDDPRFSGTGVADQLLDEDKGHDATDCRAAVEAGTATYNGEETAAVAPTAFDYGSDTSKWANDGECDDPRFTGAGVDKKLLDDDLNSDATDCKVAVDAGTATIREVYTPEYAAGAPYDSSGIDFGDNTSDYADDEICDDPRFEGPKAASILLEDDTKHDSADCKAAYEAGGIVLIESDAS